jgi:hypothetical protein
MMKWRLACLSTRNSILPPLMSVTALADVHRDGAGLRVGHEAAGAQDLAETTDLAHEVRGGDDGVEVEPAAGDLLDQVVGTDEVGAGGLGGLGLVAVGEDEDAGGLARAVGRLTVPRTIWSALRGSTPRRMATSTVSSYLVDGRSSFARRTASSGA